MSNPIALTSGVAVSFPMDPNNPASSYLYTIANTAAQHNMRIELTGCGPNSPAYYSYGGAGWKRSSAPLFPWNAGGPHPGDVDGYMYGAGVTNVVVSGAGTEYIQVKVTTLMSNAVGTLRVTLS